jgi:hypothetical protein
MPAFSSAILIVPDSVRAEMRGRSWHDVATCPRFEDLRLLKVAHFDFGGTVRQGELVVAAAIAEETCAIFERLFAAQFPLASLQRVDAFDGDDQRSMRANNSSAFNFRHVAGTQLLSHHALGLAIDLNPIQNPWVRGERVDPPEGCAFLERSQLRPGMITRPGPVIAAFEAHGWSWGGDFADMHDYHHFSKLPR